MGVYGGVVNLGNGNLTLQLPLVGWAEGVGFTLVFNSQANPSQPSPIAPKWTHNWHVFLTLNSSQTQAILQEAAQAFPDKRFVWVADEHREYASQLNAYYVPRVYLVDPQGRLRYVQHYRPPSKRALMESVELIPKEVR